MEVTEDRFALYLKEPMHLGYVYLNRKNDWLEVQSLQRKRQSVCCKEPIRKRYFLVLSVCLSYSN